MIFLSSQLLRVDELEESSILVLGVENRHVRPHTDKQYLHVSLKSHSVGEIARQANKDAVSQTNWKNSSYRAAKEAALFAVPERWLHATVFPVAE